MAKPVEGRVAAAHFGCCVCCVLCVVVVTSCTLTGRESKIRPAKMADFSALITKNVHAPNVDGCAKSPCSLDFAHVLTFGLKRDIGAL
jgi:hypothetical protein